MKYIYFSIAMSFFLISCDPGTGIKIINNTENNILIECKTIYDSQVYKVETRSNGELRGYVDKSSEYGGYFVIPSGILELKPNGSSNLINMVGTNVLAELKLGSIKSIDDIVSAIDVIFLELNVYVIFNGTKTMLYNKNYFLDKDNMVVKSQFITFNIEGTAMQE